MVAKVPPRTARRAGTRATQQIAARAAVAGRADDRTRPRFMSQPYTLHLLGGAALLGPDGTPVAGRAAHRHRLALLAVLAAARARPVRRDRLVGLLWPERDEAGARALLRAALHDLRRVLHPDVLPGTGGEVRLDARHLAVDLHAFEDAVAEGTPAALARAVAAYRGPFVEGLFLDGAEEFEQWASAQRARLAALHEEAVRSLAADAERRGDAAGAQRWWGVLAQARPTDGAVVERLVAAGAAAGDPAAALAHAAAYARRLREEHGLPPAPSVTALVERLQRRAAAAPRVVAPPVKVEAAVAAPAVDAVRPPAPAPAPTPAVARRPRRRVLATAVVALAAVASAAALALRAPSPPATAHADARGVAVLPFGGDADDYAGATTRELTATLSEVPGLRVVTHSSAAVARRRVGPDVQAIGRLLGVAALVEGSVRREGARVLVDAQVVRTADGTVAWAERFVRPADDAGGAFAVQAEIAMRVARALRITVGADVARRLATPRTASPAAHALVLRGRLALEGFTDASVRQARALFEQAVARDSTYADAWAGLGAAWYYLAGESVAPRDAGPPARRALERALALDSTHAVAQALLGAVLLEGPELPAARRALLRASRLAPGSAPVLLTAGWGLAALEPDSALALVARARALDPLSPIGAHVQGVLHRYAGQPVEAERAEREAVRLEPRMASAHVMLADLALRAGRVADAERSLRAAAPLGGDRVRAQQGVLLAATGRAAAARAQLDTLRAERRRRYVDAEQLAFVHAALGERAQAAAWLDSAAAAGSDYVLHAPREPRLAALRDDARLAAIRARLAAARR